MVRFETPYNTARNIASHGASTAARPESGAQADAAKGARKWNSWWSRRSPNLATNDNPPVALGIDAGSKTIKVVATDAAGEIVFGLYHRHRGDVLATLEEMLEDAIWRYGDFEGPAAITGSAGIALAQSLGLPFVQEVVATTCAVKNRFPQADCIIELGGEDAKITYLTGNVEQRMNATCAGGTGDFIDGIASMLGVRTREISKLALGSQQVYPIASRCAVFAQTDVRPLVNAGARKADIAQSALEAVVRQTLGGLACGRPITGTVVFLGGPLEHIPALLIAFRRKLGLSQRDGIKPPDAHLYAALGAIEAATEPPVFSLSQLAQRAREASRSPEQADFLEPLFANQGEIDEFRARHAADKLARKRLEDANGPFYLGFDAGSTSLKYVLVDESGAIVASDYRDAEGDTFKAASELLEELLLAVEGGRYGRGERSIARAAVTGYGEDLLRAAFGFDMGIVETVAHLRAAQHASPDASFVLDIGGQDMKALWLDEGHVVDAVLNEACSSGCGAFVKSSAKALALDPVEFSRQAFFAQHPMDLGAKCTVFMTSRVRHAQKAGAPKGDIAAGIAYSVVNNVMTRIIGKNHVIPLGEHVVVQGGTFLSDAVLRAFEKVSGVHAVRPDCAHLMGALGAALAARDADVDEGSRAHAARVSDAYDGDLAGDSSLSAGDLAEGAANANAFGSAVESGAVLARDAQGGSGLLSLEQLRGLQVKRSAQRCPGCSNACLLSILDFGDGRRYISGNKCERAYLALDLPADTGDAALDADAKRHESIAPTGEGERAAGADMHARADERGAKSPASAAAAAGFVVSGAAGARVSGASAKAKAPNVIALEQRLHAAFGNVRGTGGRGVVTVGLMNTLNLFVTTPFWHTLLAGLGFSVVVPDETGLGRVADRAAETIPSESVCHPAKLAHARYAYLEDAGADFVFMPSFERGTRCPVAAGYAHALADNVGSERIVSPTLRSIDAPALAQWEDDQTALLQAVRHMAPASASISTEEFDHALAQALAAQQAFEDALARAAEKALAWVHADASRRLAILAGRPYHADPSLIHRIDEELSRLGFAVVGQQGLEHLASRQSVLVSHSQEEVESGFACLDRRDLLPSPHGGEGGGCEGAGSELDLAEVGSSCYFGQSRRKGLWKPARRLLRLVEDAAADPQAEVIVLRSFGCGFDAVSLDEARDLATSLRRPLTELKIDDIADTAHIRIRLRTLAYTSGLGAPPAETRLLGQPGHQRRNAHGPSGEGAFGLASQAEPTPDLCSTAKELVSLARERLSRQEGEPSAPLKVPRVCMECLTDALPFELLHAFAVSPEIDMVSTAAQPDLLASSERATQAGAHAPNVPDAPDAPDVPVVPTSSESPDTPKVGLLGNPLLAFNADMNDHAADLARSLGWQVVYPDPVLVEVEDVRYLEQLERFRAQGVSRVLYLQSFGCLKGHVQSRGAAHELARSFPDMPITFIDYDPESSALNRENRIRLALARD